MINVYGIANDRWQEKGHRDDQEYLWVHSCGYQAFLTRDHLVSRPGGRVDYQLIHLVQGCGYFELDGRKTKVDAGSLILFRPGQKQKFQYLAKDRPQLYWIHFTGFGVEKLLRNLHSGAVVLSPSVAKEAWRNSFDEIIRELQTKRPAFQTQVTALFMQILTSIIRAQKQAAPNDSRRGRQEIDQALHLLHMRYGEKWTLQKLASEVNWSVYHFARQFKAATGLTPVQYLTRIRMNTARDLLSSTPLSVQDIASFIGYDNPLYFSRIFRQETGCSPTKYRQQT